MRLLIKRLTTFNGKIYKPRAIADVDNATAVRWVKRGIAGLVVEKKPGGA
jgi:hypothetical protein